CFKCRATAHKATRPKKSEDVAPEFGLSRAFPSLSQAALSFSGVVRLVLWRLNELEFQQLKMPSKNVCDGIVGHRMASNFARQTSQRLHGIGFALMHKKSSARFPHLAI